MNHILLIQRNRRKAYAKPLLTKDRSFLTSVMTSILFIRQLEAKEMVITIECSPRQRRTATGQSTLIPLSLSRIKDYLLMPSQLVSPGITKPITARNQEMCSASRMANTMSSSQRLKQSATGQTIQRQVMRSKIKD